MAVFLLPRPTDPAWFPRLDVYEEDALALAEEAFEAEITAIRERKGQPPIGVAPKRDGEDEEDEASMAEEDEEEDNNREFEDDDSSDEV